MECNEDLNILQIQYSSACILLEQPQLPFTGNSTEYVPYFAIFSIMSALGNSK